MFSLVFWRMTLAGSFLGDVGMKEAKALVCKVVSLWNIRALNHFRALKPCVKGMW